VACVNFALVFCGGNVNDVAGGVATGMMGWRDGERAVGTGV
jgi:hypothetical protein